MNDIMRRIAGLSLLVLALGACMDLDVVNPNAPNRERALETAGDVESLIAGSFSNWWNTSSSHLSGGPILANQSFQMASWPANFGMVDFSGFPRAPLANMSTHTFYQEGVAYTWVQNYRALAAVAEGFQALDDPEIAEGLGAAGVLRARAWGRFVQGLAHGSLALFYAEGWIVDETTQLTDAGGFPAEQPLVGADQLLAAAIGYFDQAIALANGATFTIPPGWASRSITAAELVRASNSLKARYRAAVARNPAERQAVNWNAVIAEVDAGITENFDMSLQHTACCTASPSGWQSWMVGQFSNNTVGWGQSTYMIKGMADQSGMYQDWLSFDPHSRHPQFPDGSPRLIITPDLRFPQGATESAQRADVRARRAMSGTAPGELATQFGEYPYVIVGHLSWGQPARGTFRWSYYRHGNTDYYRANGLTPSPVPEITVAEMRLLKAEALLRTGNAAGAADLINVTRVAAGLNATDAAGTNTSCVPKLPNGSCGNLMEMLKWEKRLETMFFGLHGNSWYFEGRGWGDLYNGTPVERPVPCLERELTAQQCTTTGGVGGAGSAPVSVYQFPFEG
jgi:hypothetical protein